MLEGIKDVRPTPRAAGLLDALSRIWPQGALLRRLGRPPGGRPRLLQPGAGGLRGWGRGPAERPGRGVAPPSVHLYLVRAGPGPTALDVRAVLGAGETRPLQSRVTSCFARPSCCLPPPGRAPGSPWVSFVHAPWMTEISSQIPPD